MLYAVTYDLRQPGRDYEALYKAIKALGTYLHPLESMWLVDTTLNAEQIFQRLAAVMDKNDYLFIMKLGHDWQGWLPKAAWDWLRQHSGALAGL